MRKAPQKAGPVRSVPQKALPAKPAVKAASRAAPKAAPVVKAAHRAAPGKPPATAPSGRAVARKEGAGKEAVGKEVVGKPLVGRAGGKATAGKTAPGTPGAGKGAVAKAAVAKAAGGKPPPRARHAEPRHPDRERAPVRGAPAGRPQPGRPAAAGATPAGRAVPGKSPVTSTRRPRTATGRGTGKPAGRAELSADPLARDWADTGDPEYEPDLDNAGAGTGGHRGDAPPRPGAPARNEPPRTFWNGPPRSEEATVILPRTAFEDRLQEAPPPRQAPRGRRPARRSPMIVQGIWPALLAAGLALATSFGLLPLAVAVLAVQVFFILGALALLDAPAAGGAFVVATGAVAAADAVVLLGKGSISQLAGVVGVGLVAALVHQLARRDRSRVTESLADTLVVLVVAVGAACLLAFHDIPGGEQVLQASLAAAGAALLAGRLGDLVSSRPILAVGSTRGWPGLLLSLAAGVAAAAGVSTLLGEPPLRAAALLGLVVASTVATADLAVDLGAAELRSGWRDARRVAALRPTALLLPYAVLGPVALLAGRLLLT